VKKVSFFAFNESARIFESTTGKLKMSTLGPIEQKC